MITIQKTKPLFQSFWQAGFECADHINRHGQRVDLVKETGHDILTEEDYIAIQHFNLRTVREGIGWSKVEKTSGKYDWSEVIRRIEMGQKHGIQQIWGIHHFGYPEGLSPFDKNFTRRFVAICQAFARLWRTLSEEPLFVTPINEISFISWLGGEVNQSVPNKHGRGFDVKYQLVKACIAGMDAIRAIDSGARFMHTEPLVHILPVNNNPETLAEVAKVNEYQFQALDMLSGRMCPELGGRIDYLDIIGYDFYFNNQWEHFGERIQWHHPQSPRWTPLSVLLKRAYERYHRPILLSETSHLGVGRGEWILQIGQECEKAIEMGVDLNGICLYPIIDRPDWDNLQHYHNSGFWDLEHKPGMPPKRILCEHYAKDLQTAQARLEPFLHKNHVQKISEKQFTF